MDAVTTDGPYGRELLQFVRTVPLPPDPVLERYRASICVDHGDWDGLQRHLSASLIEGAEPIGVRDAILAPLSQREPPLAAGAIRKSSLRRMSFSFRERLDAGDTGHSDSLDFIQTSSGRVPTFPQGATSDFGVCMTLSRLRPAKRRVDGYR